MTPGEETLRLDAASKQIQSWFKYNPTEEQCEKYTKSHTQRYANMHFYLVKFNRPDFTQVTHTFSSSNMQRSNILDLISRALEQGSFASLEKITIKQYSQNGGGDIPCCLMNCQYEGDWPPCMQR